MGLWQLDHLYQVHPTILGQHPPEGWPLLASAHGLPKWSVWGGSHGAQVSKSTVSKTSESPGGSWSQCHHAWSTRTPNPRKDKRRRTAGHRPPRSTWSLSHTVFLGLLKCSLMRVPRGCLCLSHFRFRCPVITSMQWCPQQLFMDVPQALSTPPLPPSDPLIWKIWKTRFQTSVILKALILEHDSPSLGLFHSCFAYKGQHEPFYV